MPKKSASSGTPGKDKGKEETIGVFETPTKSDDETSVSPVIEIVDSIFAGEDEMQEDLHIISLDEAVRMKRWMEICKVFPRKQPVNDNHTEEHRRSVALSSARNVRDIIQGSRLNGKFWGGLTYDTCKRVEAVYDEFEGEVGDARDFHLAPMSTTILPRETVEMIENLHANLVREWSEYARVARDAGSTFKRSLGYNPGKPVRVMGTKQLVWCQVEFYIKLARFLEREDRYTPHNFISYLLEIFDETWKAYPNLGLNELLKRTFWWIPESVFVVLSKPKDRHKLLYEITKKAPLWREAWRERSWKNGDPDTFPEWGEVLRELLKSANAGKAQNPRVGGKRDQEEPDSSGDNNRTGKHRTEKGVKPGQEKHRGSDGDKSNTGAAKSKTIDDEKFVKFANRLHNGQCVGCGAVDHPLRECKGADPEAGTFLRLRQAEPSKYRERLDRLVPLTDEERAAKRSAKGETVKSGKDQAERSNKERGMVKSMNFVATVRETEIKTVLQKRLLIYPKNVTDERHGMPVETLFDRCTFMAKRPVKKGERLDETNTQHGAISAELAKRLGANVNPYENEIEGRGASEKRRFKVSNWTGEHIDVYVEGWATFAMAAVMQEGDTTILREFQVDLDVVEGMGIGGAQVILGYRFHKEQDDIAEAGGHPIKDDTVIDVPPADFATTVSEKVEEKPSDEDYGEDERTIPAYGGDDGELDVEGRDELHQIGKETFESRYESVRMHVSLHKANEAVQRLSDRVLEAFTVLDGYIKQGAIPPPEILSVVAFGHADFWNLTPKNAMDLFQICQDYGHIFRVKQIPNEGYRVDPARDELIATYQPRGHHNIYGDKRTLDKQRAIMEEKVANGEWEKTTKSVACLSPVFLVDNKGTKKSRLVCDSRTANEMVKPIDHPTEEIRMQLEMMSDAAGHYDVDRTKNDPYLCVTDGHKAFDNVPYVDEKGIYATRIGSDVYVPKRIPTGSRNAPAHLNRAMHQVFKGMVYKDVFHYVDDMFFGGRTQEDTISRLKRFFERCSEMNVGLKLEGSQFLRKNILAAGYHIEVRKDNSIAWTKYPRRMVDLIQFDTPKTCDEVAWLLFISNYVREHIPNYDGLVEPLRQYLDGKPKTTKEQKKIVVAENEWGDPQRQALETLKRACGRQLSLSAPRPDYMFAVICDASQFGHGSLLVQFPPEQSEWDFGERDYTVIATHSGRFNTEEKKRHIRQKEWQACVCALKAYEKFLRGARGPLLIYTDHQSLVSLNLPDYKSVAVHDRLLRWNTLIADFRPIIRHVPGALNSIADMLSRQTGEPQMIELEPDGPAKETRLPKVMNVVTTRRRVKWEDELPTPNGSMAPVENLRPVDFNLVKVIAQCTEDKSPREDAVKKNGLWIVRNESNGRDVLCVPKRAVELVLAASHDQRLGHPGAKATAAYLAKHFWWEGMNNDVAEHVKKCITCQVSSKDTSRSRIGRSYFGVMPWDQVSMDFAQMVQAETGEKYFLLLMDTFSGRVHIKACMSETAEVAAQALYEYGVTFSFPDTIWSDRGTHFESRLLKSLAEKLQLQQYFGVANAPWTKGVIERGVGIVKDKIVKLMTEFRAPLARWPSYLGAVQMAINNSPSTRLAGYSPNEILFRGARQKPLFVVFDEGLATFKDVPLTGDVIEVIGQMRAELDEILRGIEDMRYTRVEKDKRRSHRESIAVPLSVGDYVLIAETPQFKSIPVWTHVGRIDKVVNEWVYEVRDVIKDDVKTYHVAMLRPFDPSRLATDLSKWDLMFYKALNVFGIESIDAMRLDNKGRLECQVNWNDKSKPKEWCLAKRFVKELPGYFRTLLGTRICADPQVFESLKGLLS